MSDVTPLLDAVDRGEPQAADQLLPLVYEELRKLAAAKMANQPPGQTLQATALLHEAWLKLAGSPSQSWANRQHFFRALAEAMRHVLVDRARRRAAGKHGGSLHRTELLHCSIPAPALADELLVVHEALEALAQHDAISAELVKLRYFVGMSMTEAAEALDLPLRRAERMWAFCRAWLRKEIIERSR